MATTAGTKQGRIVCRNGDAPAAEWRLLGLSQAQVAALGLGLIVLLGAALRFYKLGAYSIGNAYYAATVKSMLTSWHNFFFAAYEPGGSVTVDKPPLGFWLQAVSAYVLGLNGFALALPQALAGTLSIPVLYGLVRCQFGRPAKQSSGLAANQPAGLVAGLAAALALATLPVAVSAERNNTIDGVLVLLLLLAAWAFWRAARSGRLAPLLAGAVLVGLGFNVKMLQAFLPLPAFYALYLLGAPLRWGKRLLYLGLATVVLLAVSLSWAVAVDLTPADSRPYIGSSTNNTVLELIVGHNGLKRLNLADFFEGDRAPDGGGTQPGDGAPAGGSAPDDGQGATPLDNPPPLPGGDDGGRPAGQPGMRPSQGGAPPDGMPADGVPPAGAAGDGAAGDGPPPGGPGNALPDGGPAGGGRSSEVGQPGWLRLFTQPLVGEAGWLLPLALLGLPLVLVVLGRHWPLTVRHLALVLWAGWLLPEVVYFSLNSGLFHAYYLIMLGPPLAALVGATAWALWRLTQRRRWLALGLLLGLAAVTLLVQIVALGDQALYLGAVLALALPLLLGGLALLDLGTARGRLPLARVGLILALLSLVVGPLLWAGLTTLNQNPDVALPRSGPDTTGGGDRVTATLTGEQAELLDYLLAHAEPDSYLLAALSSHETSPYILATGRPALTFGGFNGGDDVVTVEQLAAMVEGGELRYVLGGRELTQRKPEIGHWVESNCTTVPVGTGSRSGPGQASTLYDCAAP
jgi:4-amino-4-deoxy-L-arabinose transferase-like glycosyltransferase